MVREAVGFALATTPRLPVLSPPGHLQVTGSLLSPLEVLYVMV